MFDWLKIFLPFNIKAQCEWVCTFRRLTAEIPFSHVTDWHSKLRQPTCLKDVLKGQHRERLPFKWLIKIRSQNGDLTTFGLLSKQTNLLQGGRCQGKDRMACKHQLHHRNYSFVNVCEFYPPWQAGDLVSCSKYTKLNIKNRTAHKVKQILKDNPRTRKYCR